MPLNIEFKARCANPDRVRDALRRMKARAAGIDQQTDTYFIVPSGRLKLRDGNVERNLIYYQRGDAASPKRSDVWLTPCQEPGPLHALLTAALGVRCVVEKRREIYFHGRTKIHVDDVRGLGSFVEVEVIAEDDQADVQSMHTQCNEWMAMLGVTEDDLIESSYSDMILSTQSTSERVDDSPTA